mmetsp:Transcript_13087/g.19605  ORF Transcript_13087/g.19605 Transcript_13087/m.19605 type:complete len:289 (+) Transcript_13087:121-987(+)
MASSDLEDKVVIEQTLLTVEETFVYKVPPMPTSTGFRAEDWNLAKPISTCSLLVTRVDSTLSIQLFTDRPKEDGPPGATEKHLFAQCTVLLDLTSEGPTPKMDYWVEAVMDSSRYFVMRISDKMSGREAHIGIGFRERNDALNFKMSLDDYVKTMRKEALIERSHLDHDAGNKDDGSLNGGDETGPLEIAASKLSLKKGEKIHINIKGAERKPRKKSSAAGVNAMLLKKPPPPAAVVISAKNDNSQDVSSDDDNAIKETTVIIGVAPPSATVDDNDEDEGWGDFESVP